MISFYGSDILNKGDDGDDDRHALIIDRTIFYPQGGGQPADTGFIRISGSDLKFVVQDVRSKHGTVSLSIYLLHKVKYWFFCYFSKFLKFFVQ